MTNELNLTPELLEKAKSASSAAALLALAQGNGITFTAEQAAEYFAQLHPEAGALSDAELDNVSGGWCSSGVDRVCKNCGHNEFKGYTSFGSTTWYCKKCNKPWCNNR